MLRTITLGCVVFIGLILMSSCTPSYQEKAKSTVQIGENSFVYDGKVYRIIENQVTELGDLERDSISRSAVLNPALKDYGSASLSYVKRGASAEMQAVYRGDILYFKLDINGLNDLRERFYSSGSLTLNLLDEYSFQIHSIDVRIGDLVRIIGYDDETLNYEYNGKAQMSAEIYEAISSFSVSSSLEEKSYFN